MPHYICLENNVNGFRFSSHGAELPVKTINFEDMVTPMVESRAKKQPQKKSSATSDHSAPVQNDSEQIRAARKRSKRDKTQKKARVSCCVGLLF